MLPACGIPGTRSWIDISWATRRAKTRARSARHERGVQDGEKTLFLLSSSRNHRSCLAFRAQVSLLAWLRKIDLLGSITAVLQAILGEEQQHLFEQSNLLFIEKDTWWVVICACTVDEARQRLFHSPVSAAFSYRTRSRALFPLWGFTARAKPELSSSVFHMKTAIIIAMAALFYQVLVFLGWNKTNALS